MNLKEKLSCYNHENVYPMHMPGHKRNSNMISMGEPYAMDITEIKGFDDLHDAKGILACGMERAANLFGSEETHYLVNGSTCGILAAITASAEKGASVLVARNCHKSVYHGLEIQDLEAYYLNVPFDDGFGICGSILPEDVANDLQRHKQIQAVILTSPTYEGIVSDLGAIAQIAHNHGVPLIVDEAHGAHFNFSDTFPQSAVALGADLVVQSLHKTLPALTQTAVLHCNGDLIDREKLRHQLEVFQTSSPSYLLMASMDQCISLLDARGTALFQDYQNRLAVFSQKVASLKRLRVFCKGNDSPKNHPSVFQYDPGKVVISCRGAVLDGRPLSGPVLMDLLREQYNIELEMASTDYVIAMTSIADTDEGFRRLAAALKDIDAMLERCEGTNNSSPPLPVPETVFSIAAALRRRCVFMDWQKALGKVSAEYVYAYPPGIPLLAPGERISQAVIGAVRDHLCCGVNLHSTCRRMPKEISVLVDFDE